MNQRKTAPIGVFDSGVGGLTVAREIMRNLPGERIVYFGNTARVPYGSKSKETVIRYSRQIVRFLKTQEVKAIVVACNTASALALETIQQEIDIPMLGVVEPGAKVAAQTTVNKKIGLIGHKSNCEIRPVSDVDSEIRPGNTGDWSGLSLICSSRGGRLARQSGNHRSCRKVFATSFRAGH